MATTSIKPAVNDPFIIKNLKVKIPGTYKEKTQTKKAHAKIFAIDFDGTLCKSRFPFIGEPNTELIQTLQKAKLEDGARLILWTCRTGEYLKEAVKWCEEQGLFFDAINDNLESVKENFGCNPRKIYANLYIDDQAFHWWGDNTEDELCKLRQK